MTDILELAKQAGFLPEYIFNADDRFAKLEALLREKFIAELVPTAWMLKTGHGVVIEEVKPDCAIDYWKQLYALPKDKY